MNTDSASREVTHARLVLDIVAGRGCLTCLGCGWSVGIGTVRLTNTTPREEVAWSLAESPE